MKSIYPRKDNSKYCSAKNSGFFKELKVNSDSRSNKDNASNRVQAFFFQESIYIVLVSLVQMHEFYRCVRKVNNSKWLAKADLTHASQLALEKAAC